MSSLVDVSELMNDPEFVQPVTIVRRTPCVDSFGQNRLTESSICTHGSIQPVSGRALQRLPDALRVADVQSFWLKEPIVVDGRNQYPDILVKNGVRFAVQLVFDWSSWGQGWSEGICVREAPTF